MIKAYIDFNKKLRDWDGFGFNYVETCQTSDYTADAQDYSGFSTLAEDKKQEILSLIFGDDGLKPSLIKMFFDPFHRREDKIDPTEIVCRADYDHETTSKNMRYFVKEGLKKTRARGDDLSVVTTLYGPPAFMTRQKFVRGRDLDPRYKGELAKYFVSWVKYLKQEEGIPVRYISLHNEGEDFTRWPADGSASWLDKGHDYNMHWPPELVAEMIPLVARFLKANGLHDVGMGCGETTNWLRFSEWGYAKAIEEDAAALNDLDLITSHGFVVYNKNRWFADTRSAGIDRLREKKPSLHAWTTSVSWAKMDVFFLSDFRNNIYAAKVNGVIPWAGIQWPEKWLGKDPNPGCAIRVDGKGNYSVEQGYYYYKQICRAGQAGMAVCDVTCNDTELQLIGFSANGTHHADAFVVLNVSGEAKTLAVETANGGRFIGYRTSEAGERYEAIGEFASGTSITVPPMSATTFYRI